MSFLHFVFAGPLLFFVRHAEARVYLLAIIVSHAFSFGEIFLPLVVLEVLIERLAPLEAAITLSGTSFSSAYDQRQ